MLLFQDLLKKKKKRASLCKCGDILPSKKPCGCFFFERGETFICSMSWDKQLLLLRYRAYKSFPCSKSVVLPCWDLVALAEAGVDLTQGLWRDRRSLGKLSQRWEAPENSSTAQRLPPRWAPAIRFQSLRPQPLGRQETLQPSGGTSRREQRSPRWCQVPVRCHQADEQEHESLTSQTLRRKEPALSHAPEGRTGGRELPSQWFGTNCGSNWR